jgi:hypothetical protein
MAEEKIGVIIRVQPDPRIKLAKTKARTQIVDTPLRYLGFGDGNRRIRPRHPQS